MNETAVAVVEPKAVPAPKPALETGARVSGIIPRNLDEVARVAQAVIVAGLAPDSYRSNNPDETKSRVIVGIMKGAEVGLPPLSALSTIAIINGRPSIWGDGAMALVQNSGTVEWAKETLEGEPNTPEWVAICAMKRKGQSEPYVRRFSWADALKAKLTGKGPWGQYPQRMLQMRARSWCLRDGWADALMGLSIAEEAQDMPAPALEINSAALLSDDAPANDGALRIEHKPDEPRIYTLKDSTAKAMGSFDNPRGYLKALRSMLDAANDADRRALWFNNRELVAGLPADFNGDREAMFALYEGAEAAE